MTQKSWFFPVFNTLVGGIFGALIGYYARALISGILAGALFGAAAGLLFELLFGLLGRNKFIYRRRALLVVILEIPFFVLVMGPYAFVLAETAPNPHPVCCETPLDFGALEYEDVQIEAESGIVLSGWYVPPEEQTGTMIVLLHGSQADRRGTIWHASRLIQAGYGVLMYDQRGLGESTGDSLSFGWRDGADLLAVIDFLEAQPEVISERIGVVGLSLGAQIALNAAHQDPGAVAAFWLDGLPAQTMADFPEPENYRERFATFINRVILRMTELHLGQPAPPAMQDILPQIEQPLILVVGAQDNFEARVNARYEEVVGPLTFVWTIPQAGHLGGPALIPDEYTTRMLQYFGAVFP